MSSKVKAFTLILCCLKLFGCATGGPVELQEGIQEGVIISNVKEVKNCKFVGEFYGSSPFYGIFEVSATKSAKEIALKAAKKAGATHIVLEKISSPSTGTKVIGKAYRCQNSYFTRPDNQPKIIPGKRTSPQQI